MAASALIEAMEDPGKLFALYNLAASEDNARQGNKMALWSPVLLERIVPNAQRIK